MPDIDGLEVVAIMNQEFSIKPPKVIMLSAFESPQMREQASRLGIESVVKKPFGTSELINNIQELCLDYQAGTERIDTDISELPNLAGKTILLVEDNALNQKVALGLLKDSGAKIEVASNGIEAIDILRRNNKFDVVLMDIQMPDMDGLKATKVIRNELQLTMPIIAMTAHAMQQDIDMSIAAGMTAHLTKPVEPKKLFNVLATAISVQEVNTAGHKTQALGVETFNETSIGRLNQIDKARAMQSLLNDEHLYKTLLNDFLDLQSELDTLHQAIKNQDNTTISRVAHIYSTALKYIGAYNLADFIRAIELTIQQNKQSEEFVKQLDLMHSALFEMNCAVKQIVASNS